MSRQNWSSIRFWLFWGLAGSLELSALALFFEGAPMACLMATAHLTAAALVFFAPPKETGWFSLERHWCELGLCVLALPGLGWVLAAVLWLSYDPTRSEGPMPREQGEEDETLLRQTEETPETERELAEALDILPATDALLGLDPAVKRGAIETLAKIRTPQAIAWLLEARSDPNSEVRFYATSALANLASDYEHKLKTAERQALENPSQATPQVDFCRLAYDYALSGLLEAPVRRDFLIKCQSWLEDWAGKDTEALKLLYLVDKELGPGRALSRLELLAQRAPAEGFFWLREKAALLFKLRRYPEVLEAMRHFRAEFEATAGKPETEQDREWSAAVLWWSPGE